MFLKFLLITFYKNENIKSSYKITNAYDSLSFRALQKLQEILMSSKLLLGMPSCGYKLYVTTIRGNFN